MLWRMKTHHIVSSSYSLWWVCEHSISHVAEFSRNQWHKFLAPGGILFSFLKANTKDKPSSKVNAEREKYNKTDK